MSSPRYVVGIDLGTTNCALASLDLATETAPVAVDAIAQLVNVGEVAARPLLPSFLYLPDDKDFPPGSTRLPWSTDDAPVIGELARRRGAERPGRLVASAKSWLCHGGVDRTAPILPWGGSEDGPRVSPLDASARYLRHLAQAWEQEHGGERLCDQDVLVTVPASFDEAARELTLRATWRDRVAVGDLVLVCDVGGGTTDFSLIAVTQSEGALALTRVAVGDHILLGGDNMDLALARAVQQRLEQAGDRVDATQLQALWLQCCAAKERLFEDPSLDRQQVTLLGRGARLVGGTIKGEVLREDLNRVIVEGFFPRVAADAEPARQRRVGLQELGLPYAADPAITRHLARFLMRQAADGPGPQAIRRGHGGLAAPTHVLFNGGVMKAPALRDRVLETLNDWLTSQGCPAIGGDGVLDAPDLDRAVARGAAFYGRARRRNGIRIRGGSPRAYYVGIESAMPAVPGLDPPIKALCVVPFGMEEGTEAAIAEREFGLLVGEPAEFRFLSSTVRKHDAVGTLIEDWGDDLLEQEPLEVVLEGQGTAPDQVVPVRLEAKVTEVGTLELWCVSRDGRQRWKLELNIRERAR